MISRAFLLFITVVVAAGCQSTRTYQSSSVVDFLYSDRKNPVVPTEVPRLSLPLKVGIAFTPAGFNRSVALTEKSRIELMDNLSARFRKLDFVQSIAVIPSAYLRPRGGFSNLEQVKRMFDVDVIALVSYDQTTFTDEGLATFAYWTIVGAYIIPGEKNLTHTMLDLVLYDIDSRKMLLRAPGTSSVRSRSTPINLKAQTRKDALKGFIKASEDLAVNLNLQLDMFKAKVKNSPEEYQVVRRAGYSGSGSTPWFLCVAAVVLLVFRSLRRDARHV